MRCFDILLLILVLVLSTACNRDLPVSVDSGGAIAMAVDVDQSTVDHEIESTAISQPTSDNPAVWSITLNQDQAMPGETVTLRVRCNVHPDWHIYSVKGPTGVARPTKLDLRLPGHVTMDSDWELPNDTTVIGHMGPESRYSDESVFSAKLKVDDNAPPESVRLQCEVHYQVCKETACLPPTSAVLELPFVILTAKEQ